MSQIEKLRELVAKHKILFDTPLGIYVVTIDGDFVECNDRVRKILQLPSDSPLPQSIKEFYYDPAERDDILTEMRAMLNGNTERWMDNIIRFKVKGREKFIKDYTRALYEPESRDHLGFLCCMIDVTEKEMIYNRLIESSPVGIYKLDEKYCFVEISNAAIEMLGYKSKDELIGRPLSDFCADPQEETKFRHAVDNEETVHELVLELKKKNDTIFISLSAFRIISEDEFIGLAGTMVDVTRKELYRLILESVPMGLYKISERGEEDIIIDCNKQFAELIGFNSIDEAIGFDIKKLNASEESYNAYMQELIKSGEKPLPGYTLEMKIEPDESKWYEVNSRLLFDGSGKRIGRAGAMRDISEKAQLKHRVEELTVDIGQVLHTYSHSLVKIQNSLKVVLQSLEPDPFKKDFNLLPDLASDELLEPAQHLSKSIEELMTFSSSQWGSTALPTAKWQILSDRAEAVRTYRALHPRAEAHPPILRTATFKILDIWNDIQKTKLPNHVIRQVKNTAQDLLRICNLISLHQMLDLTLAMDHAISTLREYVTSETRPKEEKAVYNVSYLLGQAISHLNEFAINRGVEFHYTKKVSSDPRVEVSERDVVRALDNLWHNAIKYSWERKKGEAPWILISTTSENDEVHIYIQNWGVPIPQDEIDNDLIFQTGFRGRLSSDRGRVGTGIGLADARRVAKDHGGEVHIKSVAAGFKPATDYKQPFLTTATIVLPLYHK